MTIKTFLGAAVLALTTAAPVAAVPINLDFSFGGVSGTFFGLDNADGTSSATSFDFYGVFDTYLGVVIPVGVDNSFTFLNGDLFNVDFDYFVSTPGQTGAGTLELLRFSRLIPGAGNFSALTDEQRTSDRSLGAASGDPGFTQAPVSPVPLPAGAALLLTGLVGIAGLKRRKKHTA